MFFAKHTVSLNLIMWLVCVCCCYCFERESQCVDQSGLELKEVLLPLLPECEIKAYVTMLSLYGLP